MARTTQTVYSEGIFHEWAASTEDAANEALNIVDDSPFTYGEFWPVLVGWYGIEYGTPDEDESTYTFVTLPGETPPRGFGKPGVVKIKFSFEEWASRAEVKEAWASIQERENLNRSFDP